MIYEYKLINSNFISYLNNIQYPKSSNSFSVDNYLPNDLAHQISLNKDSHPVISDIAWRVNLLDVFLQFFMWQCLMADMSKDDSR